MGQLNWNRQLGLALCLFILGTGVYWLEFKNKPEREASEEQKKHLFHLQKIPVESIKIQGGRDSKTSLKSVQFACQDFSSKKLCKPSDNSTWEITHPLKTQADDAHVNSFLSSLESLTVNEVIDLSNETKEKQAELLKEYGLDLQSREGAPQVEVKAENGTTVLFLGVTHPMKENLYAARVEKGEDQFKVYLIPSYFRSNLENDLNYWRDKKIFAFNSNEIKSFQFEGKKGDFGAIFQDSEWILKKGALEVTGDKTALTGFLSSVCRSSAKAIRSEHLDSPEAKALLKNAKKLLKLTLNQEKENKKTFILTLFESKSSSGEKIFATVSHKDLLLEIEPSVVSSIDKSFEQFRLNQLMTVTDKLKIKHIEFSGGVLGNSSFVFFQKKDKKPETWILELNQTDFFSLKITSLLDKLMAHRSIEEFVHPRPNSPHDKEILKVWMGDETEPKKYQFIFWKVKDKVYAQDLNSKHAEVYRMSSSLKDVLPWNPDFFKLIEAKSNSKPESSQK